MTVEQPQQEEAKTPAVSKAGWGTAITVIVLLLLLAGGGGALVYYGIHSRTVSANTLAVETRRDAGDEAHGMAFGLARLGESALR